MSLLTEILREIANTALGDRGTEVHSKINQLEAQETETAADTEGEAENADG
jgi:hypothetical protein